MQQQLQRQRQQLVQLWLLQKQPALQLQLLQPYPGSIQELCGHYMPGTFPMMIEGC